MRLLRAALMMAAQPTIGGQAVIEGVMMRSPKSFAIAVRRPDGQIAVREEAWASFATRYPVLKLPILRGATMLVESLYNGLTALNFSASVAFPEDEKAQEQNAKGKDGLWLTLALSMAFAFFLFKGVPHLTATGLGTWLGHDGQTALPITSPLFHVVDGVVKLMIFLGYITLLGRTRDVSRLFMYHGAEHKSVHVYEAHEPLDVAHATPKTTAHPRCGTSLILLVLATSMVVFAAVLPFVARAVEPFGLGTWATSFLMLAFKAPLLLPIAGVGYELQRFAAKHPNNALIRLLIAPGMFLQRLTTREPTAAELEVALVALRKTVWREAQNDAAALRGPAVVEVFPDLTAMAAQSPTSVTAQAA